MYNRPITTKLNHGGILQSIDQPLQYKERTPVEGGLDVPEEVEGQLLGFILAGHLAVLLVLGSTQRVSKGHLQCALNSSVTQDASNILLCDARRRPGNQQRSPAMQVDH